MNQNQLWKNPWIVLLGTIIVGSLGSGLWEIAVKPSLMWGAQRTLDIATLGSTVIKDQAYTAAALDQTALPSAKIYVILNMAYIIFIVFAISPIVAFSKTNGKSRNLKLLWGRLLVKKSVSEAEGHDSLITKDIAILTKPSQRMLSVRAKAILVVSSVILWSTTMEFLIANQSLLIWRCFHSDLKKCAPFLSTEEEELIESQYASMESKKDYAKILIRFESIATEKGFILHSSKLW
jgi:hypothetical protein